MRGRQEMERQRHAPEPDSRRIDESEELLDTHCHGRRRDICIIDAGAGARRHGDMRGCDFVEPLSIAIIQPRKKRFTKIDLFRRREATHSLERRT